MTHTRRIAGALAGVAVVSSWLFAAQLHAAQAPQWTVSSGDVRVRCPMTVGGSFEARTSSLSGHLAAGPGTTALNGRLDVDLSTLDTGISLRNRHMLETYLEVQKGAGFDMAELTEIDVGPLVPEFDDGQRPFTARLRLHGTTRTVTGVAGLSMRGSTVRVDASFPVRIPDYGIAKPRHLGIGVKDEVTVHVVFLAAAVIAGDDPLLRESTP